MCFVIKVRALDVFHVKVIPNAMRKDNWLFFLFKSYAPSCTWISESHWLVATQFCKHRIFAILYYLSGILLYCTWHPVVVRCMNRKKVRTITIRFWDILFNCWWLDRQVSRSEQLSDWRRSTHPDLPGCLSWPRLLILNVDMLWKRDFSWHVASLPLPRYIQCGDLK